MLDNCEHVLAACAELADALLRACPSLTVLATSRAPFGVPGETAWRVPSMSLPADAYAIRSRRCETRTRCALFLDRATQVRPDFGITEANAPAIAQICKELDGIPLAIELAAARVRMLAPAQIADRLGDRFHLLTDGTRTAVPRQQTLQASIDWSYELLSEGERTLLRRLSAFTGGWTLDAAEQVCGSEGIDHHAVLDLLTGLVDQSLVTTAEHDVEVRYGLLETVRQYATARLSDPDELHGVAERHLAYYVGLAERAEPVVLRAGRDDPVLQRLATELPNLRAALERAAEIDPAAAGKRFDLLLALGDAQWWAGHVSEASATFQSATFLARQFKDPHRLAEAALRVGEVGYGGAYMEAWSFDPVKVEVLDEALAALGEQETVLRVRVLARLATALYLSPFDSLARRDSLSRASVELARRLPDGPTLAYALHARHLAVWGPDNVEERVALSAEIIDLAQQAGDFALEITGHVWQLSDLFEIGDMAGADRELEAHEALARRVGYPQFIAHSVMFRATQAMWRGEFADAEALAQRSLAIGDQVGDVNVRTSHHVQMALLAGLAGTSRGNRRLLRARGTRTSTRTRQAGEAGLCLSRRGPDWDQRSLPVDLASPRPDPAPILAVHDWLLHHIAGCPRGSHPGGGGHLRPRFAHTKTAGPWPGETPLPQEDLSRTTLACSPRPSPASTRLPPLRGGPRVHRADRRAALPRPDPGRLRCHARPPGCHPGPSSSEATARRCPADGPGARDEPALRRGRRGPGRLTPDPVWHGVAARPVCRRPVRRRLPARRGILDYRLPARRHSSQGHEGPAISAEVAGRSRPTTSRSRARGGNQLAGRAGARKCQQVAAFLPAADRAVSSSARGTSIDVGANRLFLLVPARSARPGRVADLT